MPDAKHNNLHHADQQPKERVLTFGSVNGSTFKSILPDWIKLEVSACGKIVCVELEDLPVLIRVVSSREQTALCRLETGERVSGDEICRL